MTVLTSVSTPSTGDDAIFALKQQAVTAGWSVPASGDGVATYGPASDVITTSAALGTSGAWFRLRMPGATRELLFTRKADATAWTIKYSVAGFSGGSPSATVSPTATDSQTCIDGTLLTTNGTYRWVISADNTAPYGIAAAALTTGTLAASAAVALLGLETGSCDAADLDPYVAYAGSTSDVLARGELYQAYTGAKNFRSWYRYAPSLSGSSWAPVAFMVPWMSTSNIGGTESMVGLGALSSVSGQEVPLDVLCGFRPGPSTFSFKGRVRGARYVSSTTATAPNGTHLTDGNALCWVRVGDLWLQWDASVPSL